MKKFRKILGIVMIFIMVLAMVPKKASSISSDYDPYEAGKLQAFLNHSSAIDGKSNGQALNPSYNADEPTTWSGITWSDSVPMYVTGINWGYSSLAGSLDLDGFTRLNSLNVNENQLTSINVAGDSALNEISCYDNELTSLTLEGATNITNIYCSNNHISSLNVDELTELSRLDCDHNQLTTLDVRNNAELYNLFCNNNLLTEINLNGAANLYDFNCGRNQLTSLDLSMSNRLFSLDCSNNQLSSLNVSFCPALTQLTCNNNKLTSLNLAGTRYLYHLDCSYNQLTSLDFSASHCYTTIICNNNLLTSLDLDTASELYNVNCTFNHLGYVNYPMMEGVELEAVGNGYVSLESDYGDGEIYVRAFAEPMEGASFIQWTGDGEFDPTMPEIGVNLEDDHYELEAHFTTTNHHVTFYLDGGDYDGGGALEQVVEDGGSAALPITHRTGFTLDHWDGVTENIREDVSITAVWVPEPTPGTISPIPPSSTPTPTPAPTLTPIPTTAPTSAPVIQVVYCLVNFDLNGGTRTGGGQLLQYVLPGASAAAPEVVRNGYIFTGWDSSLDNIKKSVTIKAQWEDVNAFHKVTFDLNGGYRTGGGDLVQKVADGGAAAAPQVSRDEYNFTGWDKAFDKVTENLTVTASWEAAVETIAETYTVTYDSNGGEGTTPVDGNDYLIGDTAVLADGTALTMEGYEIAGWSFEADGDVITDPSITVDGNTILYAIWTPVEIIPEPTEVPVEEPDTDVVPTQEPDKEDIPKTGVTSDTYLGIMLLAFGGGFAAFEIIKRKRTRQA